MTQGSVTKLVRSHGSRWGRIQPRDESRQLFFNVASLEEGIDFSSLDLGQTVEFEEHADHVNGAHAERVVLVNRSTGSMPEHS
jgi:cold shock CspA family protein